MCWLSPDRPERFFVPHTYVEACRTSGMLLKQLFIIDGQPIRMHIDSSIANVNVRATMSSRILVCPHRYLYVSASLILDSTLVGTPVPQHSPQRSY